MIELETFVVAILGALLGGFGATWLRIRHERDEAFRDRQITAADDFSTGLRQALLALDDARRACVGHGFYDPEELAKADAADEQPPLLIRDPKTGEVPAVIEEALDRARQKIAEVEARHARIELLFGPYAVSPQSGSLALIELDAALHDLEGPPLPDLDGSFQFAQDAKRDYRNFNKQALKEIRGRPWHRRWRSALWVRRRIRLLRAWRAKRRTEPPDGQGGRKNL